MRRNTSCAGRIAGAIALVLLGSLRDLAVEDFFLLCLLYFGQAEVYLIDASVAALSKPVAIRNRPFVSAPAAGVIYDFAVPLGVRRQRAAGVGDRIALPRLRAVGLCALFSGRGALHPCSAPCSALSWWRMSSSSSFPVSAKWLGRRRKAARPIRCTG